MQLSLRLSNLCRAIRFYSIVGGVVSNEASKQDTSENTDVGVSQDSPTQTQEETVENTIKRVAKEKNFEDVDLLLRIAKCESTFRACAKNPNSSATGTFQYLIGTWNEGVRIRGLDWTPEDRCDPEKATDMIIWHINRGNISKWNESKFCWNK